MNLYTILGAALTNPRFARLLFEDPLAAAQALSLVLTHDQLEFLKKLMHQASIVSLAAQAPTKKDDNDTFWCDLVCLAYKGICPHPPCPIVTLVGLDDDFDDDSKGQ